VEGRRRDVLEARFYSIKSFPERFALWQMGSLIGDLMQPALQYSAPFLLTMGVHVLDPNVMKSVVTANHVRATQNAKSKMADVMPDVGKKLQDWTAAANAIDIGSSLVSLYHQLAIFSTPGKSVAAQETANAIWRGRGFQLNADVYMHRQALLASLPMTLSEKFHKDLAKMRRVSRKTMANAIHLAPLIAEWRGTRTPALVFGGRRGQLMTLDIFDNDLGNYNFAIIGAPGSGKSVLMNEMAWSYRAIDAKVWMLDLGRSFEKLCRKAKGTYIEFKPDVDICLNPFTHIVDINEDIDMLVPAISKMASMSRPLDEVQYKAISAMVLKLFKAHGNDLTVTALRDAFKGGTIEELGAINDPRIKDLAIMLNPYARGGQYERFFEGRNNVDFDNDFVVIENEELKRRPDLHAVVNILLLHQITGEMYLTRNRRKVLFIDELKQQLGDIGADDPVKAAVVEEAARRARKYGGSLGTATQSADDYYGSAQMEAAFNCSDWVFLLRQKPESIEMLDRKGRLSMDEPKKRLLNSLRTEPGVFSEVYISSPVGEGVARNILDPATHLLFSNKLEDNAPIDELRAQGLGIDEAIAELLRRRGHRRYEGAAAQRRFRLADRVRHAGRLRPAGGPTRAVVGVVDVGEVYRQKEAEFTLILTKAGLRRRARQGHGDGTQFLAAPAARAGRTAARMRLPGGAQERRCRADAAHAGPDGAPAPQGGGAMRRTPSGSSPVRRLPAAHARALVPLRAGLRVWGFAYARVFVDPTPRVPVLFNWTPSLPYSVALDAVRTARPAARRLHRLRVRRVRRAPTIRGCAGSRSSRSCAACPATR
jgi:conjugal transfer ATP-binding protein TraC